MSDLITCPSCHKEFPLSESLRESLIRQTVDIRLASEREQLLKHAQEEADQATRQLLVSLREELAEKNTSLQQAQANELAVLRQRRALEEEKRELELRIERRLHDERQQARVNALKENQEEFELKLAEKDKLLTDLREQLEDARRKSLQGSQQLQGEVLELALEGRLKNAFPMDEIVPVQKGRLGGDVIHRVAGPRGLECGAILWESKRTKSWSQEWLIKNREDQRRAGAQIGVIITSALPKGVTSFDQLDSVWVGSVSVLIPLARALRTALIESALARASMQAREEKMAITFEYLTGTSFRQRVSAIVESCVALHDELEAEKRAFARVWAKRERHLAQLMNSTAGMYGDIQAIVGGSLPNVVGLSLIEGDPFEADK